ncbi:MAG: hypothetical protein L3J82_02365 [Planctomycetes bacterium]|nr:hypothetical protein [Planctomycetota bacterium]
MKRLVAPAFALFALVALLTFADQPAVEAKGFKWETDLKVGLQKAKDEGKPVFLVFR